MEQLPLPNDPVNFGDEKIILLCEEEYDGGSFLTSVQKEQVLHSTAG